MSGTGSIARMPSPPDAAGAPERFWVETLGCPKNPLLIKTHWGGGYSFAGRVAPA